MEDVVPTRDVRGRDLRTLEPAWRPGSAVLRSLPWSWESFQGSDARGRKGVRRNVLL